MSENSLKRLIAMRKTKRDGVIQFIAEYFGIRIKFMAVLANWRSPFILTCSLWLLAANKTLFELLTQCNLALKHIWSLS